MSMTQAVFRDPTRAELQADVAAQFGRRRAVLCGSAGSALALTLDVGAIGRGSHVLCPPFLPARCALAIRASGLTPVFCDSEADTPHMSAEAARTRIAELAQAGKRVGMLIAGDSFGHVADLAQLEDTVMGVTRRPLMIEEAASAYGGHRCSGSRTVRAGAQGDASIIDLGHNALIDVGAGGAILTDDDAFAAALEDHVTALTQNPAAALAARDRHITLFHPRRLDLLDYALGAVGQRLAARRQAAARLAAVLAAWPGLVPSPALREGEAPAHLLVQSAAGDQSARIAELRQAGYRAEAALPCPGVPIETLPQAAALAARLITVAVPYMDDPDW